MSSVCCGAGSLAFRQHDPGDGESGEAWKALNPFTRCTQLASSDHGTQERPCRLTCKMCPNKWYMCCCKKTLSVRGRSNSHHPYPTWHFRSLMSQSSAQAQPTDTLFTVERIDLTTSAPLDNKWPRNSALVFLILMCVYKSKTGYCRVKGIGQRVCPRKGAAQRGKV